MKNIILLTLIICTASFANTSSKLHHVLSEISHIRFKLSHEKNTRDSLQSTLKKIETSIGKQNKNLRQTRLKLKKQNTNLKKLIQQQQQDMDAIKQQRDTIAAQLRSAYMMSHLNSAKILLQQQNPNKTHRMMTYYHYLTVQRAAEIKKLQTLAEALNNTQQKVSTETKTLKSLFTKQGQQAKTLRKQQSSRKTLLKHINKNILTRAQTLNNLETQKNTLQKVLRRLAAQSRYYNSQAFNKLRGKLLWPIKGTIIEHFGAHIDHSQLRWNGVLIKAHHGQSIHAIAPGNVIFANWMPGYGLLLIIDHGKGYMTIYGRNQSLYKKVGDTVKAGDLITRAGNSGGHNQAALYFAIRHDGKPLNPAAWCTDRGRNA